MCKTLCFLLFSAMAFAQSAHADDEQLCDSGTVEAVANWAGIEGELVLWWNDDGIRGDRGLIVAASCKAMPNASGTTIAAIAFATDDEYRKTQVIALVEDGKMVAANRSIFYEDAAAAFGAYWIDTARYILSKDVRAFGVVFHSHAGGNSCGHEGGANKELTLWIREGERLRAIFGIYLSVWTHIEGARCYRREDDVRDVREASADITIGVEKTSSHGFADLSITAHVTELAERGIGTDDHSHTVQHSTARKVLKYDGQSYSNGRTLWWPW